MNHGHKKFSFLHFLTTCVLIIFCTLQTISGAEIFDLVLTSNTGGKFSYSEKDQEKKDEMLLMASSIMKETSGGATYIDLGNSFYPGILAKYSYGSAVMDYFSYTNCLFSLISSEDLRIGVQNLEFLQKSSSTVLASGNIYRNKKRIFKPYVIRYVGKLKIAFITLSSKRILFDIAEKNISQISLEEETKLIAEIIKELTAKKIDRYILVSGLNTKINIALLEKNPQLNLVISGGDNNGDLYQKKAYRIDFNDGRSLITIPPSSKNYHILKLDLNKGARVLSVSSKKAIYRVYKSEKYSDLLRRISRWKKHLSKKVSTILTKIDKNVTLNGQRIANLLRDVYRAEVAIVKKDAISSTVLKSNIKLFDIISSVNDNYPVFVYNLTGAQLLTLKQYIKAYEVVGINLEKDTIQRFPVVSTRKYRIVSTQSIHELIQQTLNVKISYENTWKNISDLVISDLQKERILLKNSYAYLEARFRTMIDISIKGFFDLADVVQGANVETPVGQVAASYMNWGIEGKVDFTFYNNYHQFILTPYIYFAREGGIYSQNLLRGTFLYNLNLDFILKPYHKSQLDTVIMEVDGRPFLFRETIGALINSKYITGSLGVGFEEDVADSKPLSWGFEGIFKFTIPFLKYFSYTLSIDSFITIPTDSIGTGGYFRSDIENSLSFEITSLIKFSVKHKWFYYYSMQHSQFYSNSQLIASIDLKTDFKF